MRTRLAISALLVLVGCGGGSAVTDAGSVLDAPADDVGAEVDAPAELDAHVEADAPIATASLCDGAPGRTLDVMFVGNSQIDVWNMARLVSSLSESAPPGCPRVVGRKHTRGGANLRDLWETTGLELDITDTTPDVVVITESIDLADSRPAFPALFIDYGTRVVEASRSVGARPIFYATGYVELPDRFGFTEMAEPQLALGEELDVEVATGGLAWLRAWEVDPSLDLYHSDRAHPGFHGSYLSALVIWATLMHASPIGLTNTPVTDCTEGPCAPISEALAATLQRVADDEWRSR